MTPNLYYMYFAKDPHKIEAFLLSRKKDPVSRFYIGLANEQNEMIIKAMPKLLKYKKAPQQAIFLTILALSQKKLDIAKSYIQYIKQPCLRAYYEAVLCLENHHMEDAYRLILNIKKEWMREALIAEMEKRKGNIPQAKEHIQNALHLTKGIQKLLLYKEYNRLPV